MRRAAALLALVFLELTACVAPIAATDVRLQPAPTPVHPLSTGASRCQASDVLVICSKQTRSVWVDGGTREVLFQLPLGPPPAEGWPVVFMFQGSFFRPAHHFDARRDDPFGAYFQALTVKALLDAGYAVLVPETKLNGATFWDTNIPPWSSDWSRAPDKHFMDAIFADVASGAFGQLSTTRWHAAGISSGGYMTSRMALENPDRFRSVAIQSASYATCAGPVCSVPAHFAVAHPPTLFLHGGSDAVVPQSTMESYRIALEQNGCDTREITRPSAGHEWLPEAPAAILAWFRAHP